MDDSQIVALFFEQNEEGIKEAERKYKRYLHTIANSILSSKEDVEERISDTYLAAWQSIPPNKPNSIDLSFGIKKDSVLYQSLVDKTSYFHSIK